MLGTLGLSSLGWGDWPVGRFGFPVAVEIMLPKRNARVKTLLLIISVWCKKIVTQGKKIPGHVVGGEKKAREGAGREGEMRLDQFVADVMEQLRDFVPEGGEVHFECTVYPYLRHGGQVLVYNYHGDGTEEKIVFSAIMSGSRASIPATQEGHQN